MDRSALKILVVSSKYPPEYAGSGWRAHRTYKRLARKFGFEYKVLCGSVAFNRIKDYSFENIWVYRIARKLFTGNVGKLKNGINYLLEALFTWGFLSKHGSRFDLIHIFGSNYVTAAVLTYAKITKKPFILNLINWSDSIQLKQKRK